MARIITMGEILVEIMAQTIGQRFDEPGAFTGPFPSGAPAIFADQAAKCGSSTLIISAVGNDGFGALNLKRLTNDGVDTTKIRVVAGVATGVAFVTYQADGARDFIYHIANAACGAVDETLVAEADFHDCKYFHVMGSSFYSAGMKRAIMKGLELARKYGATITFDPNVRKEIQRDAAGKRRLTEMLYQSQIILAGADELQLLTDVADEAAIMGTLFANGAQIVVVKRGSHGATLYTPEQTLHHAAYPIKEIDPTGAGDCFAGTFVGCLDQGKTPVEALRLAIIAGALAVTRQGPMEGTTTLAELHEILS